MRNALEMAQVPCHEREVVVQRCCSNERVIIADHEPAVSEIATNDPKLLGNRARHGQDRDPAQKIAKDTERLGAIVAIMDSLIDFTIGHGTDGYAMLDKVGQQLRRRRPSGQPIDGHVSV